LSQITFLSFLNIELTFIPSKTEVEDLASLADY